MRNGGKIRGGAGAVKRQDAGGLQLDILEAYGGFEEGGKVNENDRNKKKLKN